MQPISPAEPSTGPSVILTAGHGALEATKAQQGSSSAAAEAEGLDKPGSATPSDRPTNTLARQGIGTTLPHAGNIGAQMLRPDPQNGTVHPSQGAEGQQEQAKSVQPGDASAAFQDSLLEGHQQEKRGDVAATQVRVGSLEEGRPESGNHTSHAGDLERPKPRLPGFNPGKSLPADSEPQSRALLADEINQNSMPRSQSNEDNPVEPAATEQAHGLPRKSSQDEGARKSKRGSRPLRQFSLL